MGTLTAQILAGEGHPNDGGINPSYSLFLSENSRPAWILVPQDIREKSRQPIAKRTWIPTVEHMLEDALVMIAVHVSKNTAMRELVTEFGVDPDSSRMEMYSAFDDAQRGQLYAKCMELRDLPKLIVSVFRRSTIERQLSVLEKYQMDVEVCVPRYSRLHSQWTEGAVIDGSLER